MFLFFIAAATAAEPYLNSRIWFNNAAQILLQHGVVQCVQMCFDNDVLFQFLIVFL